MVQRRDSYLDQMGSLDLFAHANPALVALVVYWLADGYQEQRRKDRSGEQQGVPVLWAIVGTAMMLTGDIRRRLPKNSRGRLTTLCHRHPSWRPRIANGLGAWQSPFWQGLGYGSTCGAITLIEGKIIANGGVASPSNEWEKETRKLSRALGKIFAKESSASAIHAVFGYEVLPGEG